MSGAGSGGSRGNGPSLAITIPSGSRKLVHSLKEIVNCSEVEIYAMLCECDMDPDEAVNRLLSQDTFHEVKNKRDKKKETREFPETKSRTGNNISGRGARGSTDRGSRNTSSQSSSIEHGVGKGKVTYRKENGGNTVPVSPVLEYSTVPTNPPQTQTIASNLSSFGNTTQPASVAEGISMPMQSLSGFHNSWLGKQGQMSMADIVKMGRPQARPSIPAMETERSDLTKNATMSNVSNQGFKESSIEVFQTDSEEISESFQESDHVYEHGVDDMIVENWHISQDGWFEQPMESASTTPGISGVSAFYENTSDLSSSAMVNRPNYHIDSHLEGIHLEEKLNIKTLPAKCRSTSASSMHFMVGSSVDAPHLDEGTVGNTNSHLSQRHELDHCEDGRIEISSAAANLGQLSLQEETSPIEPNPAVIIPEHLRVTNSECTRLSFGSFVSGAFCGSLKLDPLKSNSEMLPVLNDAPRVDSPYVRNHDHHDVQLKTTLSENLASVSTSGPENLIMPLVSQAEIMRKDPLDDEHGLHYTHPSASNYESSTSMEPNTAAYAFSHGNAQMQSLSALSSLMTSDLQNRILPASVPPIWEFDLPLSTLLTTQSMPMRYSTTISSDSGPSVSMPQALNPGVFSNHHSTLQSLPSTTMLASPAFQHLPLHHYSQPSLPIGQFSNMIRYPFLPQNYYLPSYQQTYAANSPFHQTTLVPAANTKYPQLQYRSSLPLTSLPQAYTNSTSYGEFGNSSTLPGSFTLNHTSPSSSTIGFDEALRLHYKEGYTSSQQIENPAMRIQGAGSALPASNYYDYQSQNQIPGVHQNQLAMLGALGYQDMHHTQGGSSSQPNHREGNLNDSQSMQSQSTNHIWQRGY
ncbi:uncharacterized protein LOC121985786 isoform X2 [Zingiber officinale]|uniref:uncharacterized protein LOC121985786 isoform X2 n=1 Tax=Zingiber officinale TaxID=94328 RepID=UPI001C4CA424|nr:uncharacterized protein LOC121985786 isoform X2 [Zingiber officinale]